MNWPLDSEDVDVAAHAPEAERAEVQLALAAVIVEVGGRRVREADRHHRRDLPRGADLHAARDVPRTIAARLAEALIALAALAEVDAGECEARGRLRKQPERQVRVADVRRDADREAVDDLVARGERQLDVAQERGGVVARAERGGEVAEVRAEPALREEPDADRQPRDLAHVRGEAAVQREDRVVLAVTRVGELVGVVQERLQVPEREVRHAAVESALRGGVRAARQKEERPGVRIDQRGVEHADRVRAPPCPGWRR